MTGEQNYYEVFDGVADWIYVGSDAVEEEGKTLRFLSSDEKLKHLTGQYDVGVAKAGSWRRTIKKQR